MLDFVCHGHKLLGVCLTVLRDKLHVGDTEHPRKIHTAVTFPAD